MHNEQTSGPFDAQVVEHTQRLYLNRLINSAPLSTSNQELNSMFEYEESRYQYLQTILRSVLVGGHARVAREQFRKTVRSIREATNVLPARPDQVSYLLGTASELFISDTEIELIESGIAIAIAHDIGSVLRILLKAKNTSFIETMSTAMLERMTTEEDVSHLASDSADEPIHTDNDEQSEVNAASETAVAPDTIRVFHLSKENRAFLFSLFDKRAKTSMKILAELLDANTPLSLMDLIGQIDDNNSESHLAQRMHVVYSAIKIIKMKLKDQDIVKLKEFKKNIRHSDGKAATINMYQIIILQDTSAMTNYKIFMQGEGQTDRSEQIDSTKPIDDRTTAAGDVAHSVEEIENQIAEGTLNAPLSKQILDALLDLERPASVREIIAHYSGDENPSSSTMTVVRLMTSQLVDKFPEYMYMHKVKNRLHYGFIDSVRRQLNNSSVRFGTEDNHMLFTNETKIFVGGILRGYARAARVILSTLLESTRPMTLSQLIDIYQAAIPHSSLTPKTAVLNAIARLSEKGRETGLFTIHKNKRGRISIYSVTRTLAVGDADGTSEPVEMSKPTPASVEELLTSSGISASDLLCIHGYIDAHKEALTKIMPDFADLLAKIQVATDTNTAVPPKGKALRKERQQILGRMLKLTSNELEQFSNHGEDPRIELIKLVQLLAQLLNRSSEHPKIELITYIETHVSATIAVEGINVQGTVVQ